MPRASPLSLTLALAAIVAPLCLAAPRSASGQIVWTTVAVDTVGDVGRYSSLALDSFDRPHISYRTSLTRNVKYAQYDGATWITETVDGLTSSFAQSTSIDVDTSDDPSIAYGRAGNRWLMYASKLGSAWTIEILIPSPVAEHVSLELDATDVPHITYSLLDFTYTHKLPGSWTTEVIANTGASGIRLRSTVRSSISATHHPETPT